MSMHKPLVNWDTAIDAYLTSRHVLGRMYKKEAYFLNNIRTFLVKAGANDLDQSLFDQWRKCACHLSVSTRVVRERAVYNFCHYRRRRDADCFLPDPDSLARPGPRPLPIIIERAQIVQLLHYVSMLRPKSHETLRPAILRMAIILLYTTGLRRGELVRLTLADVDTQRGVFFIRESKCHKSRWVPLSSSVCVELRTFINLRRQAGIDSRNNSPLICKSRGGAYSNDGFCNSVKTVLIAADIKDHRGYYPRVQDFRHSFAVTALLRWYENNADVQVNLPKLALYMGHVSIISTAYYLRWMPAVIAHASKRFERSYAQILEGGTS